MSSSTDASATAGVVTTVRPVDLRVGDWTRHAPGSALGDEVSERTLVQVAEQARAAAQAQGYSVGWAQGRREAAEKAREAAEVEAARLAREEERREAEHREAVLALRRAAEDLRATFADVTERIEVQGTELAWALVTELVGHEVRAAGAADVVRRVLALAPTGEVVRVELHPDHLGDPALAELKDLGMRCVANPDLGRLDALVQVDDHAFDLRLTTAMARVREVLA